MRLISTIIQLLTPVITDFTEVNMPFIMPAEHQVIAHVNSNYNDFSYGLLASWYGPGFNGRQTANGEIYNQYDLTAAHPYLPFDTLLRVTYKGNSVIVRINDRGPYAGDRQLDLSIAAAEQLGLIDAGVDFVTVTELN